MKKIIIALVLLLINLTIVLYLINRYKPCPPAGMVLVEVKWLDSLKAVAQSPPDTVIITVDSLIYIPGETVYVDVPVSVPVDSVTNYVVDTLKTPHFDLYLFDTLRYNQIISRGFNYQLYVPKEIVKTITLMQKVPFPYEVDRRKTIYGGMNLGMINSVDLSYRLASRNDMIGVGFGYVNGKRLVYARYSFPVF